MWDKDGKPMNLGEKVLIEGEVVEAAPSPNGDIFNVTVKFDTGSAVGTVKLDAKGVTRRREGEDL